MAANQPYDEAIEVGDEEEVASVASPHPPQRQGTHVTASSCNTTDLVVLTPDPRPIYFNHSANNLQISI